MSGNYLEVLPIDLKSNVEIRPPAVQSGIVILVGILLCPKRQMCSKKSSPRISPRHVPILRNDDKMQSLLYDVLQLRNIDHSG